MANNEIKLNGEIILTVRDTTAVEADVLAGKIFTKKDGTKGTGTIVNNGILSGQITSKGNYFSIPAGYATGGSVKISSTEEAKIIPTNIRSNVKILGITGSLVEGVDTSDGTATAAGILNGQTAYVNGSKITGSIVTYAGEVI